jgi:hypothetical protein
LTRAEEQIDPLDIGHGGITCSVNDLGSNLAVTKGSLVRLVWMRFTCRFLILVLFQAILCFAQTQFPNTPAGHQATVWLQAFNSGDREQLHDFRQKNLPDRAQHMDEEMRFRAVTGGFDLKKLEEITPTKVVALVQERNSEQIGRLTLDVDSSEPHRITSLDLRTIPSPAEFARPHMGESELIAALSKKLDAESAADRFSG